MFLQRIQKHLRAIFILTLVFTQGLIFIASQASSGDDYNLSATFIEPILGQNIEIGQDLSLEAQLSTENQVDFSQVFFTVSALESPANLSFEAQLTNNGNYKSVSSWDTSSWDSGVYQVSAIAYVYDQQGLLEEIYQSTPGLVNLYKNNYQIAAEIVLPEIGGEIEWVSPDPSLSFPPGEIFSTDTMHLQISTVAALDLSQSPGFFIYKFGHGGEPDFLVAEAALTSDEGDDWGANIDISGVDDGTYIVTVQAITSPNNADGHEEQGITLSSSIFFTIDRTILEIPPDGVSLNIEVLHPTGNQTTVTGDLNVQISLPENEGSMTILYARLGGGDRQPFSPDEIQEYGGSTTYSTTIDTTDGEYPDGDYFLSFLVMIQGNNYSVGPVVPVTVDNEPDPIVEPIIDYTIYLDSPVVAETVPRNFLVNFHTGFEASGVIATLTSENGQFTQDNSSPVPGTSWVLRFNVIDIWTAGPSNLNILASHASGTVEQNFTINIESLDPPVVIDPGDVTLNLLQGTQHISGQVNLKALANYSGLAVEFFAIDTLTQEQVWIATAGEVSQQYVVSFDTTQIPDGNYEINARTEIAGTMVFAPNSYIVQVLNDENEEGGQAVNIEFWGMNLETSGLFRIITLSSALDSTQGINVVFKHQESGEEFDFFVPRSSWDEMEEIGFDRAGNETAKPFVYIKLDIDSRDMPNGVYNLSVVDYSTTIALEVTINNDPGDQADDGDQASSTGDSASTSNMVIELYTSCIEVGITSQAACDRFRATMDQVDSSCIEQSIYDVVACEDYLSRTQVEADCQEAGIVNVGECQDYLLEKYSGSVDCQLADRSLCADTLRNQFLNRLVVGQKQQTAIGETVDPLIGQTITVIDLNQKLLQKGVSGILPLESNSSARVLLTRSTKETVLEDEEKLTILNQAVMMLDRDGDGLSDDLEDYYGTNPDERDSDGDGYDDGTEIQNGYNPNGSGVLEKERTVIDQIILSGLALEQPKAFSKKVDKSFSIREVNNSEEKLGLKGKAEANSWVFLYLYSDLPLVMSTKTDASGNWSYDIKNSLADGHHQVYVTVNDDTGKIIKQSKPISFLVKSAQAVTAEDYFDTSEAPDNVKNMMIYYILGAALLIILALGAIMFMHSRKNNGPDIGAEDGQI